MVDLHLRIKLAAPRKQEPRAEKYVIGDDLEVEGFNRTLKEHLENFGIVPRVEDWTGAITLAAEKSFEKKNSGEKEKLHIR